MDTNVRIDGVSDDLTFVLRQQPDSNAPSVNKEVVRDKLLSLVVLADSVMDQLLHEQYYNLVDPRIKGTLKVTPMH